MNPYAYAADNPFVFTDPSGEFTMIELNATELIDSAMEGMQNVVLNRLKSKLKDMIFQAVSQFAVDELGDLYPPLGEVWKTLKSGSLANAGRTFENLFKKKVCGAIGADGPISSMLWFYPGIDSNGKAESSGLNCPNLSIPGFKANLFYPDFVLSDVPPADTPNAGESIIIGDVKLSGNSLYNQYVKSGPQNKRGQFDAIARYAGTRTYTRTAVFLTVFTGQKSKLEQVRLLLAGDGLKKGVVVVVIAAKQNQGFNDLGE